MVWYLFIIILYKENVASYANAMVLEAVGSSRSAIRWTTPFPLAICSWHIGHAIVRLDIKSAAKLTLLVKPPATWSKERSGPVSPSSSIRQCWWNACLQKKTMVIDPVSSSSKAGSSQMLQTKSTTKQVVTMLHVSHMFLEDKNPLVIHTLALYTSLLCFVHPIR